MSIKRTKQRTFSRRDEDSQIASARGHEPEKQWEELIVGQAEDAFQIFSLKTRYAKGALLAHPTFGKGVVVTAGPTIIEVLFKEGKKKLGHGVAS